MSECTADLGHPCDGGGRDEDGTRIPCDRCLDEAAYWHAYYGGLSRAQLKAMDPRKPGTFDSKTEE
jgi:hypothetical protein